MYQLQLTQIEDNDPIFQSHQEAFFGRKIIIEEEDFVQYVFNAVKSREKLLREHGTNTHHFNTSMKYYQLKYPEWEWKRRKSLVYAASKYGNKHGAKPPSILVPKEELIRLHGYSVEAIAKELGVSVFLVRRAFQVYGIENSKHPARVIDADFETLRKLDWVTPGIVAAIDEYYTDPNKFFKHVNIALDELYTLIWFLNDFKASYRYTIEKKNLITDEGRVSWQSNKHERMVGMVMRDVGIPFIPQYPTGKYLWDFKVGDRVLVEIDGGYHSDDATTQKRDKAKQKIADEQNFIVLRYSTVDVEKDIERIISEIQEAYNKNHIN